MLLKNLSMLGGLLFDEKEHIVKRWVFSTNLYDFFLKQEIERESFIDKFGLPILMYFIDVLNQQKQIGQCPSLMRLLEFLKSRHVGTSELFRLCTTFKKSVLWHLFKNGLATEENTMIIHDVFDANFEGVLKKYGEVIYEKEMLLKESESILMKYKKAVDASLLFAITGTDGVIKFVNDRLCEVSGFKREELVGKKHNILRHPDSSNEFYQELWKTIASKEIWHGVMKNRKKSGDDFFLDQYIMPLLGETGEIKEYLGVGMDITLQKQYERDFEEQQNLLFQSSKFSAMGEMISMIAHQWRQPLSTINMIAANMETKLLLDTPNMEQLINSLHDINEQTQHLSSTISDFRSFFNPNKEKKTVILEEVINKAVAIIDKTLYSNNIMITVKASFKNQVSTYPNEILQVLLNLIKNANDALIDKEIENKQITLNGFEKEGNFIIEVSDNAGGVNDDIKEKIFEPYFTTKDEKNGTGLGLYISKIIIENHCNGKLDVRNTENEQSVRTGAVFTITLHA